LQEAVGQVQQHIARSFEDRLAEILEDDGRWKVRRRVKKISGRRIERTRGQDLGDVDVLAADPAARLLVCLDAKALAVALAPHQLRNELDETFTDRQEPSSAAVRLRERADFVTRHLQDALGELGIACDARELGRWTVKAAIVTDREVLSALLDECPTAVLDRRGFEHAVTHGRLSEAIDEH
jgi:hypothetical protein